DGDRQIALCGQDLRPIATLQARLVASQQSLERDYEKMRKTEARYRLLFQNVSDAFLIVDAADGRVVEANPKAGVLFGCLPSDLAGRKLAQHFDKADRSTIDALLAGVLASARSQSLSVTAVGSQSQFELHAQLFRAATATLFMIRVSDLGHGSIGPPPADDNMIKLLESSMDGVALVDEAGNILWTNEAFLDLTQLARIEHAQGASLGDFLGRTELDFSVLLSNTRQHGRLRSFSTTCRGAGGMTTDVEISAVAMPNGTPPGFGFVVRDVSIRSAGDGDDNDGLPRSAEQLTELIGRMPLRDVVRTATDVIEKMCIETALRMTGDNRASAAEMLGLSRQSLYVKLRRYELGDPKDH
ncbi:MAG: transcriptional regulator PpsR, partial [Pseudomonadota bacterium]